jgi:SAM-dependent methyltransferase
MKRVVTGGELTQRAMRPADLLDRYLAHVEADIRRFNLLGEAHSRGCPACGGDGVNDFVRLGFTYQRCRACGSLFVSPLPAPARLARYHADGDAEKFRREQIHQATADVRGRHSVAPRARWVLAAATARLGPRLTMVHAGPEAPLLIDLLAASSSVVRWPDARTEPPLAAADCVLAFDALEWADDLSQALSRCRAALRQGGLLFVTTVSGDGFEIRMLGARSRSLVPPMHLHLLSRAGWRTALARAGFALVEYSTPGELDVQAVAEACRRHSDLALPAVIDQLVRSEDEQVARAFQEVLQQACLSSLVQLVAEA